MEEKKSKIQKELERKYPFPRKPVKSKEIRMAELRTSGATTVQMANEGIKQDIMEFFEENAGQMFTITEFMESCAAAADLSNQRVSALLRQLVSEGRLERLEEKRRAYFRYIE